MTGKSLQGRKTLYCIFALLPLSIQGCFPHQQRGEHDFYRHDTAHGQQEGDDQATQHPTLSEDRLLEFITYTTDLSYPWKDESADIFAELNSYETRTKLQESALVVGLLRLYLHRHPQGAEGSAGSRVNQEGNTLKAMAESSGVNLATAFAANANLKTYEVFELCLQVLKIAQREDPEYAQNIETPIRALLERWQKLGRKLGASSPHEEVTQPTPIGPEPAPLASEIHALPDKAQPPHQLPEPGPPPAAAAAAPQPGDGFIADEAQLREAQSLIDQANYPEAITRLQQFKADSPFYGAAQEKIKAAKNLAVQDLRKKAASAFQSSMPVSDPKAKGSYLSEAQGFLEQAIALYPDADQIDTVKENLAVIKKNLSQLN